MDDGPTKTCSMCAETKPLTEFFRSAAAPDGWRSTCKSCSLRNRPRRRPVRLITEDGRECTKCGEFKSYSEFYPGRGSHGHRPDCKACKAEQDRGRVRTERQLERDREHARRSYWANSGVIRDRRRREYYDLKAAVFDHFGNICACCGSTDNLEVDHVNGDGDRHRAEIGIGAIYVWLVKNNFPADPPTQLLCSDCNESKGTGEHCRLYHLSTARRAIEALSQGRTIEV